MTGIRLVLRKRLDCDLVGAFTFGAVKRGP